ncbi:NAD-dependent epimerase/dehydratase family protein [Stieleria varia]|uniref:3 beta-hydroxysteroid dehydrogenase/Delta 5-->4-isomerase n=1 Tax=Stieleria varia TaxID=2528005 RepID=A0A5C6AZ19_9BACT|nr:NAD-dependent epimerase/dehydratase family protein [Stieleria varia]TWU04236.1 3 beta-hydroxysteroid dehydrogenase/Delta 5-->4-isomerase [Stieleria varia]
MAKALVTGATGFIGLHLVEHLTQRGDDVRCLVRRGSDRSALGRYGAEFFVGDLTDQESLHRAVKDVDVVYHLAGVTKCFSVASFEEANVVGVRRLATACSSRTTPPRFVHVSSLAAAGPSQIGRPRKESDEAVPVSNYGRSKLAGEFVLREFVDQIPVSIVRPPVVLGPGDKDGFLLFDSIARFGLHLVPGRNDNECSFISASDLVAAMRVVSESGQHLVSDVADPSGIYFVADSMIRTFGQYGQMIGHSLGREHVRVVSVPNPVIWCVAAFNELVARIRGHQHILNFDKAREAGYGSWACSSEKLERETGFVPAESLQTRIDQTVAWYVQKGWLPATVGTTVRAELQ